MDVTIYGDRVRTARILRNRRSGDLAAALGWAASRQTVTEQAPSVVIDDRQLSALTKELSFPEEFFSSPPSPPLSPDEILFRAPAAMTKREKAYLTEFARIAGDVLLWLDSYNRLPPVRLPAVPTGTAIADAAQMTREAMGLSADQPIGHLAHRMERSGIPVIVRSSPVSALTEKHLGYSTRIGYHRERPLSVVQVQDSWERTRWTLAHETGHLVLHGSSLPANAEDQAHEFAGQLLAPAEVIREELPRFVTLASLTEIKLRWGLSIGSLIRHLYRNGLIARERYDTLGRQLYTRINPETGRTWGKDEPGWDLRETERPSLISHWMKQSVGAAAPNLIASISRVWPADIIAMIVDHQRPAETQVNDASSHVGVRTPKARRINQEKGSVVDISAFRLRA